jgi:P-type Cu+ transporter
VTPTQLWVSFAGLAAIGGVNWYFFAPARAVVATPSRGPQKVRVTVDGGYSPALIEVQVGRPVTLEFERRDQGTCTEEVVLPDFGIRRYLPSGSTTAIQFTPERPGTYEFACGMGMVRGTLRVRPEGATDRA